MIALRHLAPPPAGFPDCGVCAYRVSGTPDICFPCATGGVARVEAPTCKVCAQVLPESGLCINTVCNFEDRWLSRLYTVSERAEDMWAAVCKYKYDEDRAWADILGRILVGALEEQRADLEGYDLITTGALYVGPRARRLWDHLQLIHEAAQRHGPTWPLAHGVIDKSGPTGQFLGRSVEVRQKIAEHSLRSALSVPDPERVAGRRVLVVDDVYSEGFSLREMARVLLDAGATEVAGLVFARRKGG